VTVSLSNERGQANRRTLWSGGRARSAFSTRTTVGGCGTQQTLREDLPIDLYEEEQGIPTERPQTSIFECTIEEYLQNARSDTEELVTDDVKHRLEQLGYA